MRMLDSNISRQILDIQRQYDRLCNQSRIATDILQSPAMRLYWEHCQRMERLERHLPVNAERYTIPRYTPPKAPRPVVNVTVNFYSHEDVADE